MKAPGKLLLTDDNYYSPAADREYMSCSQYQTFVGVADDFPCEARAMAKIMGNYTEKPTDAFLHGNYFHTAMEGDKAHAAFLEANAHRVYKKTKNPAAQEKYAAFDVLDACLRIAHQDASFRKLIDAPGDNEVILSGEIFGVPWRIRCDKIIRQNHIIVDWKTCASLNQLHYSAEKRDKVTFVEHYGYLMRAAVYMEIYKQNFGVKPAFILGCVTKQDPPDKGIYVIHPETDAVVLQYELDKIQQRLPYIMPVKNRNKAPKRCGFCAYCRQTKGDVLPKPWYLLDPRNTAEPEYDAYVPWNIDPDTGEVLHVL